MGGDMSRPQICGAVWDMQFTSGDDGGKLDNLVLSLGKQPEFSRAFGPVKKGIDAKGAGAAAAGVGAFFTGRGNARRAISPSSRSAPG